MRTIKQIRAQRAKMFNAARAANVKRDKARLPSSFAAKWFKPVLGIPVKVGNPLETGKETAHNVPESAPVHV